MKMHIKADYVGAYNTPAAYWICVDSVCSDIYLSSNIASGYKDIGFGVFPSQCDSEN